MFHTGADRILFLLETKAEMCVFLADVALEAEAGEERPHQRQRRPMSRRKWPEC